MAFLRGSPKVSVAAVVLAGLFSGLWASQVMAKPANRADFVRVGAWKALKKCDQTRASYWAAELAKVDPEQATLYRLAWLEAPASVSPAPEEGSLDDTWAWKRSSEFWTDEESRTSCAANGESVRGLSALPQPVLESQLGPWLPSYFSARPALRSALREFALFEWLRGRKLTLPQPPMSGAFAGESESCEWRALRALHTPHDSSRELMDLARQCSSPDSLLWAIVRVRAGDQFLKEGAAADAYALFSAAVEVMPTHALPAALEYRLAVSGMLSGAADDLVLRQAFAAQEGDGIPLTPVLAASLGNLTCERLSEIRREALPALLAKVFRPGALIPGTLALTRACPSRQAVLVWKAALPLAQTPRDRARILGLLLGAALEQRARTESRALAARLAVLSRQSPVVATHAFREALRASGAPDSLAREMIALYRKGGAWSDSEQTHFELARRASQKAADPLTETPLRIESSAAASVVRLPVAALAEPILIEAEIPGHFRELFESERPQ